MKSCPSGNRKRTAPKNRAVIGSLRLRQADKLADGQIRGKTWNDGLIHTEIQCQGDGTEHRFSALRVDHVGAGTATGTVLLKRCSVGREIFHRCKKLLEIFGGEWCIKARFAGCRFTVADVIIVGEIRKMFKDGHSVDDIAMATGDKKEDVEERLAMNLFDRINHSAVIYKLDDTSEEYGHWQLAVPYWMPVLDDRFLETWYVEFCVGPNESAILSPDYSSGQKAHLQKYRSVRENWDCRDTI